MGKSSNTPSPPNYGKLMEQGYQLNQKYTPKLVAQDLALRNQFDQPLINQQMQLQAANDPRLAQLQYQALQMRDPQAVAVHQAFGDTVQQALQRGYIDPTRAKAYTALGQNVTGNVLRGTTMDPETLRQTTQAILSRSPNLSSGEAQDMAAAVYTGQRGQQLQAQRQQAANQFLGQQSESDLALTAGGRYMGTPGLVQMENQIGGVQAPRSLGYLNPNAGASAASFGLAQYPAQLAASQNSNPWSSALGGAAAGAQLGTAISPGYGTAIGAVAGGLYGGLGNAYG